MSVIYLNNSGKLIKKGETLEFCYPDETKVIIFHYKTEQIIVLGNIGFTSDAIKLLMKYKIEIILLNKNGRFNGKLVFQEGKNVFLRIKQYKLLDSDLFQLHFCKNIIHSKLNNQLAFMQRIQRERKLNHVQRFIQSMQKTIKNTNSSQNIEQVRGYEGYGSKQFFSVYRYGIIQDWAVFKGRSMNPPKDNVNSVLSFLYTLLNYRVESAIEIEGLDSYVGYLHSLDYGRKSLAFDLMEEYRTPIVDTLTVSLFNKRILNEDDFEVVSFGSNSQEYPLDSRMDENSSISFESKKGVLLKKDSLGKVISHFEKKISNEILYTPTNKQLTYKSIIREQIKHFKRVVQGEEKDYKALVIK